MELSALTKLRIIASLAIGGTLIGFLAWPIVAPTGPAMPVTSPSLAPALIIALLALVTGFLAAVVAKPYPLEIGILAVPAGLAIWALRSGTVGSVMQQTADWQSRQQFLMSLRFQPFFWLVIVLIGMAGALAAKKVLIKYPVPTPAEAKPNRINPLIAIITTIIIGIVCIKFLAQSERLGRAIAQPANAQIAFAVFTAFVIAAFVVKRFLKCGYIWPIIGSAFINLIAITLYAKPETMQIMAEKYPANCLPAAVLAVLPIQMVAFAALGSVLGYWAEIRFEHWRTHQAVENQP